MFCPNCGKQVPENTKFCPYCGAALQPTAGTAPQPAQAATPTSTPLQKRSNWVASAKNWYRGLQRPWLVWVLALVIVIAIGGLGYRSQSMKVQATKQSPWVLTTKNGLKNDGSGVKFQFEKSGRLLMTSGDSEVTNFKELLADTVADSGSWTGDHKKLTLNINQDGNRYQYTFTKMNKTKQTIGGQQYKGYFVQVDMTANKSTVSQNMYLLHQ